MIDLALIKDLLSVGMPVGSIVYTFIATRRKDVDRRIDELNARLDRQDRRLASVEQGVSLQPGKEELHAIQLEIARMGGQLGRVEAVMEGNAKIMERLEKIVGRHEDHLLSGGKQ